MILLPQFHYHCKVALRPYDITASSSLSCWNYLISADGIFIVAQAGELIACFVAVIFHFNTCLSSLSTMFLKWLDLWDFLQCSNAVYEKKYLKEWLAFQMYVVNRRRLLWLIQRNHTTSIGQLEEAVLTFTLALVVQYQQYYRILKTSCPQLYRRI